ncbi:hydroxyproline-rich glycoprotein family protein [Medicago truncatula]|uniref:Hydroxyproline-rich glycoprotein family protein n=1 Tax=Medicago truncatula TaxID=3880 RepID=A0A072U2W0_MEDTR|nr:hydroxyproline-rich glycoprotein family protein [Medicago truncatula]
MKSFNKLKRIALHKTVGKEKKEFLPSVKVDELALAAKYMQEMRDCYDSLLAAAAATENSAYEFSESLQEMGTCLLEKTALNDDEESGKVLGMLGNVQLDLQKLVDGYRSHVALTITRPSESLLNELRTVEDMKRQCDEKREVYEYMIAQQKEKGKSKSGKGENITSQHLKAAHDEYEEEATLCAFRLKSLKQGQSRSLLTQAARHHAAQLNFFRKGLKSLEAVEPHVRMVAELQHIDYQFSGLEDDDGEGSFEYDGNEYEYEATEGGELSFNYRSNKDVPTSPNSAEVEESDRSNIRASTTETAETSLDKSHVDFKVSNRDPPRVSSYSAPIFAEKKFDPAEKVRQLLSSSAAKPNAYVLPLPVNIKETKTAPRLSASASSHDLWHSSPLDEKKNGKDFADGKLSEPAIPRVSILKESNSDTSSAQLPRPSTEGQSLPQVDIFNASDHKKIKRHAFSGPLTNKPLSVKPVSGGFSRLPMPQPSSPKASPGASPPLVSSPRISELHELPRPPGNQTSKATKSSRVGHSAPLGLRNPEHPTTNKFPPVVSSSASPLPTPPITVSRSFSIPSSSQRAVVINVANKYLHTHQIPEKVEEAASPPLTPLSQRASALSDLASRSSEIQGGN